MGKVTNEVRLVGTVKRDSEATELRNGVRVMDFCLVVPDAVYDHASVYVDCFAATDCVNQLDGFVTEGEALEVEGHLTFRTMTDHKGRKKSAMVVYVDNATEAYEE